MKKTLLTLALALAVGGAQAVPLSDLLQQGASITASDKLFDQWTVTYTDASDPNATWDYGAIDITALNDGGDNPGPGININFGNQMTVTGNGTYAYRDLTLSFHVSTVGNKKINGNLLEFGVPPSVLTWMVDGSNDLGATAVEWVRDALANELANPVIDFNINDDTQTRDLSVSAAFLPQDEIFVTKNFLVWAVDGTDTATLGGITQRFAQTTVPEPATLALFGLGLLGLGFARQRRQAESFQA